MLVLCVLLFLPGLEEKLAILRAEIESLQTRATTAEDRGVLLGEHSCCLYRVGCDLHTLKLCNMYFLESIFHMVQISRMSSHILF